MVASLRSLSAEIRWLELVLVCGRCSCSIGSKGKFVLVDGERWISHARDLHLGKPNFEISPYLRILPGYGNRGRPRWCLFCAGRTRLVDGVIGLCPTWSWFLGLEVGSPVARRPGNNVRATTKDVFRIRDYGSKLQGFGGGRGGL
jgi:hypothetical protein